MKPRSSCPTCSMAASRFRGIIHAVDDDERDHHTCPTRPTDTDPDLNLPLSAIGRSQAGDDRRAAWNMAPARPGSRSAIDVDEDDRNRSTYTDRTSRRTLPEETN